MNHVGLSFKHLGFDGKGGGSCQRISRSLMQMIQLPAFLAAFDQACYVVVVADAVVVYSLLFFWGYRQ
jgi:hypothetical protein